MLRSQKFRSTLALLFSLLLIACTSKPAAPAPPPAATPAATASAQPPASTVTATSGAATPTPAASARPASVAGSTVVVFHYFRHAGDYQPWDLWVWPDGKDGKGYAWGERDDYGVRATVVIAGALSRVGFIVRKGGNAWEAKDVDKDRFLTVGADGVAEVWLAQDDEKTYNSAAEVPRVAKIAAAYLDSRRKIVALLTAPAALDGFSVVSLTGQRVPIADVSLAGSSKTTVNITLDADLDLNQVYTLKHKSLQGVNLQPRGIWDAPELVYTGDDLGAAYSAAGTRFRVWAPTASAVQLVLYEDPVGGSGQALAMTRDVNGTWLTLVDGDLVGRYYTYKVTVGDNSEEAVDPYATGLGPNGNRGLVVSLPDTNPAGWDGDQRPPLRNPTDAIIWEVHVRDLSMDQASGIQHKGKFLGFTEQGTTGPGGVKTGLDHIVELGVTHVHLLPAFQFASTDETRNDQFNWGYDPKNFNAPEGEYASLPAGIARNTEFKQLVQALHAAGLRVVMDVVYNHTASTSASNFQKIVPGYYYRQDAQGRYTNGSGTGNETASERPMMRKFMVDSVKYWATQYHIDGFRFDLMALHDSDTMKQIRAALDTVDPSLLVYGEPWTGGSSPLVDKFGFGRQRDTRIAVFNDKIRDGIKGDTRGTSRGFANGDGLSILAVKTGVAGSIDSFANQPNETINYVSAHDDLTLWDKISQSNAKDSEADRIKLDELAQAIVLTSQGIPFLQAGEEFLRTKGGNPNTYNAPDSVNRLDWSRKAQYSAVFSYYKGLIALRKAHPAFRLPTADLIRANLTWLDSPAGTLAYKLNGAAVGDSWREIVVIYNPHRDAATLGLPASGNYTIVVAAGEAGTIPVSLGPSTASGTVSVPGLSCLVLYQ